VADASQGEAASPAVQEAEKAAPSAGLPGTVAATTGNSPHPSPLPVLPERQAGEGKSEEYAQNWPRFRGPDGSGITSEKGILTTWDGASGKGIVWKTPVPLPGHNSPVIWGQRLFVSGANEKTRKVFCFDLAGGKLLWQRDLPGTPASTAKPPKVSEDTGYAASTTASDGRRVYAIFANGDVGGLDFQGNVVWARSLGIPQSSYGYAASLATYKDLLLIQFDQGAPEDKLSKLLALDSATGKLVWETGRPVPNSWSSPIVARVGGRDQLITAGEPWVIGYDPAGGKEIWRANRLRQDVGPSPVFRNGVVYVANQSPDLSAIRADGQGDVTKTHVLWSGEDNLPDICSPLATDEYVFLLATGGTLTNYNAKTGKKLWEKDYEGQFKASPSLVGTYLYLITDEGKAYIVEPGPKDCREVATAALGDAVTASPAFHGGRMYLRGAKNVYCIGAK
jgi:outer membrane protein assembly factor BamB